MSFTVDSGFASVFGTNDFYFRVKVTATRDQKANTYTVKVDGVRGYCKYSWNFGQRIQMYLATDSKGSDKVALTTGNNYVSIPSSGSNSYKGWIPKDGYSTSCTITKKYNGNSDGSCPAVYLYVRDYNPGITDLSDNSATYLDVKINKNIKSMIEDDIGTNDRTAPSVSISSSSVVSSTSISFTATSRVSCNKWEYKIDSGSWTSFSTSDGKTASKTVTGLSSAIHKLSVRARKTSNNVYGTCANTVTLDCVAPTISQFDITPYSSDGTVVTGSFTCSHDCKYMIKKPGQTSWPTNWSSETVKAGTKKSLGTFSTIATNGIYYVKVKRASGNTLESSKMATCDTRTISVSYFTVSPVSNTAAIASFSANYDYQYKLTDPSGNTYPLRGWSTDCSANVGSGVSVATGTGTYTLQVRRTSSANLTASSTYIANHDIPVIETFTLTPITPSTARAVIKVDNDFQYRLKYPSGAYSFWSTGRLASTEIIEQVTAESVLGVYTLEVRRLDSYSLTASKTAQCDCRIPNITNYSLSSQSVNTAILTAASDYDCYWDLYSSSGFRLTSESLGPCKNVSQLVDLMPNAVVQYNLVATRSSCSGLNNRAIIRCDTTVPNFRFDELRPEANLVHYRIVADYPCTDWRIDFEDETGTITTVSIDRDGTTVEGVYGGLETGKNYSVTVSARKISNNVTNSATYDYSIMLSGTVRIQVGGQVKSSAVYIYNGGKWKLCLPYMFGKESKEQKEPQWYLGQ